MVTAWRAELAQIDPSRLVFLDESGIDTRLTRTPARAARGKRAHGTVPWGHWKRLTVLGAPFKAAPAASIREAAVDIPGMVEKIDAAATSVDEFDWSGISASGKGLVDDLRAMLGTEDAAQLPRNLSDTLKAASGLLTDPYVADLRAVLAAALRVVLAAGAATRRLTGRGRSTAATLLAHLHYIGGDGAYTGVALDVALAGTDTDHLATLLDTALRAGVRPARLWGTIEKSYDAAKRLGVVIPAATLRTAG